MKPEIQGSRASVVADTDEGGSVEGTSAVSLVPTGTILSNTAEMEIGVEPAYRETPGTSINQPSDLVS